MSRSLLSREKRFSFYTFLLPWLFGFLVFQAMPIVWGFSVSLTNRTAFSLKVSFVGLKNYLSLIVDPNILYSFLTTFIYTIEGTTIAVLTGFAFALLLDNKGWGRGAFRTILYFPYMIPVIAVSWIFRIFLDRDTGFFNIVLLKIGLIHSSIDWLGQFTRGSIVSLMFWQAGWSMIIFLGALSTVPNELYEVARIDGAGYVRRVRHIMLPLISPFILFQFVTSTVYAMQAFIQPYILTPRQIRGEQLVTTVPPAQTFFVMSRGYYEVITDHRLAYGLAMLWLLFFVILIITIVFIRFGGFLVYSEVEQTR